MTWSSHSWGWKLTGHTRQSSAYLKGDSWVSSYCCPAWDFPGFPWVPRGHMNLGAHLSQASEIRQHRADGRGQPAIIDEVPLPGFISRLQVQQYRYHVGKKVTGIKAQALRWPGTTEPSAGQVPPQHATSAAQQRNRRFWSGNGPRGHFISGENLLVKVTQVVMKTQLTIAQVSWLVGECLSLQCKLQEILNQKFKLDSKTQ